MSVRRDDVTMKDHKKTTSAMIKRKIEKMPFLKYEVSWFKGLLDILIIALRNAEEIIVLLPFNCILKNNSKVKSQKLCSLSAVTRILPIPSHFRYFFTFIQFSTNIF